MGDDNLRDGLSSPDMAEESRFSPQDLSSVASNNVQSIISPRSDFITPGANTHSKDLHLKISLAEKQNFWQDHARGSDAKALGTVYDFPARFGLKEGDWATFDRQIKAKTVPNEVEYVLVYLARHGQGYHNMGEEFVGTEMWTTPSRLSPIPIHQYFLDARLTPVGQHQADSLSITLKKMVEEHGLPWPQKFYSSPLHRALETSFRTWAPIATTTTRANDAGEDTGKNGQSGSRPYHPVVEENIREQMYLQDCNQRSTRSTMINEFVFKTYEREPKKQMPLSFSSIFTLPQSFTETDEMFLSRAGDVQPASSSQPRTRYQVLSRRTASSPNNVNVSIEDNTQTKTVTTLGPQPHPETEAEATVRAHEALHSILARTFNTGTHYISLTSHAGFMSAVYQIFSLQHSEVPRFPTGIMIPLLLRVERVPHPVTVNDVARHISSGAPGVIPSAIITRGLDFVLASIDDKNRYQRLLTLRHQLVHVQNRKITKDLIAQLQSDGHLVDELDRLIFKAFL